MRKYSRMQRPRQFPSRGRQLVPPHLHRAHRAADPGLAGDPVRAARADRRTDRLGQDARCISRRHRRPGAPGRAPSAARRDAGRLRLAAQGAVQRHPQEPGGAAAPASARSSLRWAFPKSRSARWCAPATRPQADRERMRRKPPHILVTTPESLYILLTSESGRKTLASTQHRDRGRDSRARPEQARCASVAVPRAAGAHHRQPPDARRTVGDSEADRGSGAVSGGRRRRPGEGSVRQQRLRAASHRRLASIVDTGHVRKRDLAIEVPESPLEAVMSGEVWGQVYDRLAELDPGAPLDAGVRQHAPPRRARGARAVRAPGRGPGHFAPRQHGARTAPQRRAEAQARRAEGAGRHLVAGAGHRHRSRRPRLPDRHAALDLRLCCSGSAAPATRWAGCPRAGLFPVSRDDLVECTALLDAVRREELDRLRIPQQAARRAGAADRRRGRVRRVGRGRAVSSCMRRAWPYRDLTPRGVRAQWCRCWPKDSRRAADAASALLHRDAVNRKLRPRQGLRLTAITCGGTIPDTADYNVVLVPEEQIIGTVNEDFAVESIAGRCLPARQHVVSHSARRGGPRARGGRPRTCRRRFRSGSGEAPARTDEVSAAVSRLRARGRRAGCRTRQLRCAIWSSRSASRAEAAAQVVDYFGAAKAALGLLPTQQRSGVRALLRRSRRHAARDPFAVRQPHQPRLGPEPAQALLPQVQFRAAGGRDRGRHHPVAHRHAQLPARRGCTLSATPRACASCWCRRCSMRRCS